MLLLLFIIKDPPWKKLRCLARKQPGIKSRFSVPLMWKGRGSPKTNDFEQQPLPSCTNKRHSFKSKISLPPAKMLHCLARKTIRYQKPYLNVPQMSKVEEVQLKPIWVATLPFCTIKTSLLSIKDHPGKKLRCLARKTIRCKKLF